MRSAADPTGEMSFDDFFRSATGFAPYAYQRALGASVGAPPSVLEVPTGSGKTQALLTAWLYERATTAAAPRRLVYALPMRSLVEQTRDVALRIRERLQIEPDELPIHILMGGEHADRDWRAAPDGDQILIGTIDMLLSRALNRGYGESRFAWPVAFGLLNDDCRWVFDEVQLMGAARATSAQLDGLRSALGTVHPCETVWVSATVDPAALRTVDRPQLGAVLRLPDDDRSGALGRRLDATKLLIRTDVSTTTASARAKVIGATAVDYHVPGTRTLLVANTVARAQDVHAHLGRALRKTDDPPVLALLHSRFRPPDRHDRMADALAPVDESGPGTIVVATQVVEAGVDMSSRTLITETAPFSSIVQRLGRCNRAGEYAEATLVWLDAGEYPDGGPAAAQAAPYLPGDLNATRAALLECEGTSLSPAALERMEVHEHDEDPTILRRRDLMDLFDTGPDLSGLDVDVAPFIREDDDRSVSVFFRDAATRAEAREQARPTRDELVQVPIGSVAKRPRRWSFDHIDGVWVPAPARPTPGSTIMLDRADGGYDPQVGWSPGVPGPVRVTEPGTGEAEEALDADPLSAGSAAQALLAHLDAAHHEATQLCANVGLGADLAQHVEAAAALHDVGKAHPVFQATMRRAMGVEGPDPTLWAKSGGRGGRHDRAHFRHEMASALALRCSAEGPDHGTDPLSVYLVAAHHGKVRVSIRPAPGEQPPAGAAPDVRHALGVLDGDELPALDTPLGPLPATTLSLACMELGDPASWSAAALALRDDPALGPFRLAYLEALVRVADWRASA